MGQGAKLRPIQTSSNLKREFKVFSAPYEEPVVIEAEGEEVVAVDGEQA